MKRSLMSLIFIFCALHCFAQTNTSTGSGAGNAGTGNSSFGNNAGDVITGTDNAFFGRESGQATTSANYNSFFGAFSGYVNTTGASNTFLGYATGGSNTTGYNNTFIGRASGNGNTTGYSNVFCGYYAGRVNTTGYYNSALGNESLLNNTTGFANVSIGYQAMYSNTIGNNNSVVGHQALYSFTNGPGYNAVNGYQALYSATVGSYNTASGYQALRYNTTGSNNTAIGHWAMELNTTGNWNTAVGREAMLNDAGSYNTAVGANSGQNASINYSTAIGYGTANTASYQVRIGDTNVTSIGGYQDWTNISDGRFKNEIQQDVAGLDFINQLRPVSYVLDTKALDAFLGVKRQDESNPIVTTPIRHTGFIAQEVEGVVKGGNFVFSGVDAAKNEKDTYGVRYGQFVVPLVKAVQELDQKTERLEQLISDQQKLIASLLSTLPENSVEDQGGNKLYQNSPNPFNGDTQITMDIVAAVNDAILFVYDLSGNTVERLTISSRGKGVSVNIDRGKLNSGIYLYSLVLDGKVMGLKRMMLTH